MPPSQRSNIPVNNKNYRFKGFSLGATLDFFLLITLLVHSIQGQQFELGTTPNPIGSGARALGFGNAFIAVADDATAASWNPAGLLQLEVPELSLAGEYFLRKEDMTSASNPESSSSETVRLGDLNYASIVFPFHYGTNMVLSLNYLTLFRFDKLLRFPVREIPGQPFRSFDFEFDQEGSLSVVAPAFGIALTPQLFLGITVNIWDDSLTQSSAYEKTESATGSGNNVEFFQTEAKNRFEVDHGRSFVVGSLYRVSDRWSLGAIIKPGFTLRMDHTSTETIAQTDDSGEVVPSTSDPVSKNAELTFPLAVGMGIAWRPLDPSTLSLDVTWTDWSKFEFEEETQITNPLSGRPLSEGKLDDTYTVRVGGEYLILHDKFIIPIRAGFSYDPSPSINDVDDFYTINCGTGIQLGRYNLDIAYQFRWGNEVNAIIFQGIDASEDVREHRILASLIRYF